jgi:hypothetical protein
MKFMSKPTLILLLGLCLTINLSAQKAEDLVGTWTGLATLEGMTEPNEFVLVMEMEEGKLSGHMTDQYNTMNESPIDEIKLEGGVFSFSVIGAGPSGQEITLVLKMNIDGDYMKGTLEIPEVGMNGTWEASKQK